MSSPKTRPPRPRLLFLLSLLSLSPPLSSARLCHLSPSGIHLGIHQSINQQYAAVNTAQAYFSSLLDTVFTDTQLVAPPSIPKRHPTAAPKYSISTTVDAYTLTLALPGNSVDTVDTVITGDGMLRVKTLYPADSIAWFPEQEFQVADDVLIGGVNGAFNNGIFTVTAPRVQVQKVPSIVRVPMRKGDVQRHDPVCPAQRVEREVTDASGQHLDEGEQETEPVAGGDEPSKGDSEGIEVRTDEE